MPIYEYRCTACGHQQEFLQKVSDSPLTTCTACNKPTFTKMLTAAGFQLKGSGWYATDFKGRGSAPAKPEAGKAADAQGSGAADAKGGDSKGGDSKGPDAKGSESKAEAAPAGGGATRPTP